MKTLFLEIYLLILCINAGVALVGSEFSEIDLISPLNSTATVTAPTMPVILNTDDPSLTLVENVTSGVQNDTGQPSPPLLNPIQDYFFWPYAIFQTIANFLTGGFIWEVFAVFGFPDVFVIGMKAIMGFLLVITIVYYYTGR